MIYIKNNGKYFYYKVIASKVDGLLWKANTRFQ